MGGSDPRLLDLDRFSSLTMNKLSIFLTGIFATLAVSFQASSLPNLVVSGFTWAENLAFDGLGNLFISENIRGELWRINLCRDGTDYCSVLQLGDGFSSFGGLQIPPDGSVVYAGATLDDGTTAVISTPTKPTTPAPFSVISKTKKQPNGVACDWTSHMLYYTLEGDAKESGCLMGVDLKTGIESTVFSGLDGADGAWIDASMHLLYVGLLTDKKVLVFNLSNPNTASDFLLGQFPALSSFLGAAHMLDDLTLLSTTNTSALGSTVVLGADWLGSELQQFTLDGTAVKSIPPPQGVDSFYQLTSVRWGKGPGFDPNSVYVTEGGGLFAKQTDRRVIQIPMH